MAEPEEVLAFWFPPGHDADLETHSRQFEWWFDGGADDDILARFVPTLEAAIDGRLESWTEAPRSRLALIVVLDQFSRSVYRGSARAYAQDPKACRLAVDGIDGGFYDRLSAVWEKLFFSLPLSHSEELALHERNVALGAALVEQAPADLRPLYEFSAEQARGHRDVVARFGRHPHRNALLGRVSTPAEQAFIEAGDFVHRRLFKG